MKELLTTIKKTKLFFFAILLSAFLFAVAFDFLINHLEKHGIAHWNFLMVVFTLMMISGSVLVGVFAALEEQLKSKKDSASVPSFLGEYLN